MTKILMIEDEAAIREEVVDWLTFEGYDVLEAENGRIGLGIAKREKPDLIICDIRMPEMDGYQVLYEIRSEPDLHFVAFIFLTASDSHEAVRAGMELGADDYLTKPFTHNEIINAVNSRLQKYTQQKEEMQTQLNNLTQALTHEREARLLKSRMVAMFSHDFRNPLSVIMSSATLILNYQDRMDNEQRDEKLNRIIASGKQLIQMLDDMLVVAEIESGRYDITLEKIDVSAFLSTMIEDFRIATQNSHEFVFKHDGAFLALLPPKLLRQIVANLVSNAIRYSPSKSQIFVTLWHTTKNYHISVRDSGIGIPASDIEGLFQPFHRASNAKTIKGTGLGLAIVKESLQLMGGEVKVESRLGEWTCFTADFPLEVPTA